MILLPILQKKTYVVFFKLLYKVVHDFIEYVLCQQLSCGAGLI